MRAMYHMELLYGTFDMNAQSSRLDDEAMLPTAENAERSAERSRQVSFHFPFRTAGRHPSLHERDERTTTSRTWTSHELNQELNGKEGCARVRPALPLFGTFASMKAVLVVFLLRCRGRRWPAGPTQQALFVAAAHAYA